MPVSHLPTLQLSCLCVLAIWVTAGCGQPDITVTEVTEVAAELEKTSLTSHQPLQQEIRRIGADQELPSQLDQRTNRPTTPSSFSAKLPELLDKQQTERILERLPDFFPPDGQPVSALTLEKATGFLKFYQDKQLAARKSLDGPQDRFSWKSSDGWFIDTMYVDRSQALCGLELIAGIDQLSQGKLDPTVESLAYSGRIIRLLAVDEHLVARLTAVDLRHQWLRLVALAVSHPEIERPHLEQIYQLLLTHISQWPDERQPWVVDRAIGMQTYELIRQGYYLSLIPPDEAKRLEADGLQIIKSRAVQRYVDQDEIFYLEVMRKIIDSNDRIYHQRIPIWQALQQRIEKSKQTEHYPQVAVEILLPDMQKAQERISDDRARVEAWTMAIGHCVGNNPPNYEQNPTTGKPYELLADDHLVEVVGLTPEQFARRVVSQKRPDNSTE